MSDIRQDSIKRLQVLGLLGIASVGTLQAQFRFAEPVDGFFGLEYNAEPENSHIHDFQFADFDGDGDDDCLYLTRYNTFDGYRGSYIAAIYLENALSGFPYLTGLQPLAIEQQFMSGYHHFTDLDQDGDADIVQTASLSQGYLTSNGAVRFGQVLGGRILDEPLLDTLTEWHHVSESSCVPQCFGSSLNVPDQVGFSDVDDDGDVDMVYFGVDVSYSGGYYVHDHKFRFFEQEGGAWPGFSQFYGLSEEFEAVQNSLNTGERNGYPSNLQTVKFSDLDGDGDDDMLLLLSFYEGTSTNGTHSIDLFAVEKEGGVYSDSLQPVWTDSSFYRVEVMDIDQDGDADILLNYEYYDIGVYPYGRWNRLEYLENRTVVATGNSDHRHIPFTIYPNPAVSVATLQLRRSPDPGPYEIEIVDLAGHIIHQFQTENQTIHLKQSEIGTGLYLVRISTALSTGTQKLLFVR